SVLTFLSEYGRQGPPHTIWSAVRDHVLADPALASLNLDGPAPPLPDPRDRADKLMKSTLVTYLNAWRELGALLLRAPAILWHEIFDRNFDTREYLEQRTEAELELEAANAHTEDWVTQNALTHLVPVRDGFARPEILRASHAALSRVASDHFDYTG